MQRREIRASMNVGRSYVKDGVNMLSKEEEKELELLEICRDSEDVNVGDHFSGVYGGWRDFVGESFSCIGKRGDKRRLFVTDDRKRYFAVSDGWGKKDGKLAIISVCNELEFNEPTGIEGLKEYIESLPEPHGMSSYYFYYSRKGYASLYIKALQELEENKNEHKDIQPAEGG